MYGIKLDVEMNAYVTLEVCPLAYACLAHDRIDYS